MTDKILLICVLIFLALMTYNGSKKGVIKLVYSVLAMVLSMILSQYLAVPVTNFLHDKTPVYEIVKENTTEYVDGYIRPQIETAQQQTVESLVNSLEMPSVLSEMVFGESAEGYSEKILNNDVATVGIDKICEYISDGISAICMRAIVSVTIFLIVFVLIKLLGKTLNVFSRIPGIHTINKTLGAIAGLIQGVVILWILSLIVMMMAGTPMGNSIMEMIDKNSILTFIYDTNIFAKLFKNMLDVSSLS